MKIKKYSVTLSVTWILIISQLCSSTILSGAMFYYLMGSYLAREVFPNVVSSAVKALERSASASLQNSTSTYSDTDTLASVIQIANGMGLTRQVKDLWPELECSLDATLCKKNGTAAETKKRKAPTESAEDDEETEEEAFSKPDLSASEELKGYKVFDFDNDILAEANEELAEEDPFNFYYAMKDQHKRMAKKDRQRKEFQAKSDLKFNEKEQLANPIPPPNTKKNIITLSNPIPVPRRGVLPIFIRYKVPYPLNYNIPQDNNLRNRNGRFQENRPPYIPIRRHLPPPPNPYYHIKRPSIFDSLRRLSRNILPYR